MDSSAKQFTVCTVGVLYKECRCFAVSSSNARVFDVCLALSPFVVSLRRLMPKFRCLLVSLCRPSFGDSLLLIHNFSCSSNSCEQIALASQTHRKGLKTSRSRRRQLERGTRTRQTGELEKTEQATRQRV